MDVRSGARWCDLPGEFPSPFDSTGGDCGTREEQEVWLEIWRAFLSELNERQQLKWSESFMDGSFAPAKKGAAESERPSGARGRSGWWRSTDRVFLWKLPSLCIPGGSHARRENARIDPRDAATQLFAQPITIVASCVGGLRRPFRCGTVRTIMKQATEDRCTFYVTTAIDSKNLETKYSSETSAVISIP